MNKTTEPAALAGIEPYGYLFYDKHMVMQFSHQHPDKYQQFNMDCRPIHSAATVERLVQERDKAEAFRQAAYDVSVGYGEQLVTSQAREQQLLEALKAVQEYLIVPGWCEFDTNEDATNYHNTSGLVEKALALTQDDTALHQWGAKLLLKMAAGNSTIADLRRKADELRAGK